MRRSITLGVVALALCIIVRVGQIGRSYYQAELWSLSLWQQFQRGPGASVDLAQDGPAEWERVYIFGPYTPAEDIHRILGFRWSDVKWTGIESDDGVTLIVFVREGEVVGWFEHPRSRGDFYLLENTASFSRDDARFVVDPGGRGLAPVAQ